MTLSDVGHNHDNMRVLSLVLPLRLEVHDRRCQHALVMRMAPCKHGFVWAARHEIGYVGFALRRDDRRRLGA
eukprot:8302302-Karenia_brevis.AAC.1